MDCWEILGVERFSDKKAIKIAYAKQLKQHRPDEDPEGFQQLHRAYKSALSWVPIATDEQLMWPDSEHEAINSPIHSTEGEKPDDQALAAAILDSLQRPLDEIGINNTDKSLSVVTVGQPTLLEADGVDEQLQALAKPKLSEADRQLLDEIHGQEHLLSEDWQNLYAKVSDIIQSPKHCNDLKQWQFLGSLASMNDLEFRKAASDEVFEIVAEVNAVSLDNKHLHVKRPVLNYLNQQFSWDKKWQEYQLQHPRRMLNAVYPYLEEAEKPTKGINKKRELYYYRRGAAFAIDLSLLFLPLPLFAITKALFIAVGLEAWMQQLAIKGSDAFIIWMGIYLLLLIPIQEASKFQATVGKRLLNLQVIDKRGDRIGLLRSFWRSLLTVLCCAAVKVVVFINFALSYWRSEILQDTLSQSYVILRPGYFDK
ncbi:MAG: RDD family protein [Leucothrix sp.]